MTFGRVGGWTVRLLSAFVLAGCMVAHGAGEPVTPGITAMSSGRLGAIVATLLGLTGALRGGLALARSARRFSGRDRRRGAIVAMVAGLLGTALGALVVASSAGGVATGNGVAGAIVGMVVGLIGMMLGALALARSRREGDSPSART